MCERLLGGNQAPAVPTTKNYSLNSHPPASNMAATQGPQTYTPPVHTTHLETPSRPIHPVLSVDPVGHHHAPDPRPHHVLPLVLILLPIRQDVPDARTVGQAIHILEILLGQLERLRRHIRDVLPDQFAGIDGGLVDLLQQEGPEGLHAAAQEGAVEGDVDALEGDGGEAALEFDGLGFLGRFRGAGLDDLDQVLLDVVERHGLHELLDVDLLGFEVVKDVGHGVDRAKIAGADVLLVGDVQVDDFEEPARRLRDVLDDVLQGLLVERLADARGVDGGHGVVAAARLVALDGDLHGETAVEDYGDQALDGHDLGQRRKGTVLAERVSGEAAVALHQTLRPHVLERSLLHQRQCRLGELRRRQQTRRRAVGVGRGRLVDLLENLL